MLAWTPYCTPPAEWGREGTAGQAEMSGPRCTEVADIGEAAQAPSRSPTRTPSTAGEEAVGHVVRADREWTIGLWVLVGVKSPGPGVFAGVLVCALGIQRAVYMHVCMRGPTEQDMANEAE